MAEYAQPLPGVTPHQTLGVVEAVFVRVLSAPGAADEQVIPARLKNFLSAGVNRIALLGNLVRFHYVRTQQRGGGKQQVLGGFRYCVALAAVQIGSGSRWVESRCDSRVLLQWCVVGLF